MVKTVHSAAELHVQGVCSFLQLLKQNMSQEVEAKECL